MRSNKEGVKTKNKAAVDLDVCIQSLCVKYQLPIGALYRGYSDFIKTKEGLKSFRLYFLKNIL